jgi:hypothetical protein
MSTAFDILKARSGQLVEERIQPGWLPRQYPTGRTSPDCLLRHRCAAGVVSNHPRHQSSRVDNRQLGCAIHRIASQRPTGIPTPAPVCNTATTPGHHQTGHPSLKRRLFDVIYRALLYDADQNRMPAAA